jgi:hypothetical protein
MDPQHLLLAKLLAYADLMAATVIYSGVIRRRKVRRNDEAEARAVQDAGLRGLVRLYLADEQARGRLTVRRPTGGSRGGGAAALAPSGANAPPPH